MKVSGGNMNPAHFKQLLLDACYSKASVADERFFHEDLPHLSTAELQAERDRLGLRLLLEDRVADPWFLERLQAIERVLHAGSNDSSEYPLSSA